MSAKTDLRSLSRSELKGLMPKLGLAAFRGEQIFDWAQKRAAASINELTNLSAADQKKLAAACYLALPVLIKKDVAANGDTAKLLLELADGERIETAIMFYSGKDSRDRVTCCVSTQTGCVMGCKFCATAQYQKCRNLTAGEIVSQVQMADKAAKELGSKGLTNLVYMGMGEPMLNLAQVKKSIELLNDERGLNIGQRKIAVSTCGLPKQIRQMADWKMQIHLAISLHAANDELRRNLMPAAARYPLQELLAAADYYQAQTGRRVCYEYALFKDINDRPEAARSLGKLLDGRGALINLIPANPLPETGFMPSDDETVKHFSRLLSLYNVEVQIRQERGRDINAACGQLRKRTLEV